LLLSARNARKAYYNKETLHFLQQHKTANKHSNPFYCTQATQTPLLASPRFKRIAIAVH